MHALVTERHCYDGALEEMFCTLRTVGAHVVSGVSSFGRGRRSGSVICGAVVPSGIPCRRRAPAHDLGPVHERGRCVGRVSVPVRMCGVTHEARGHLANAVPPGTDHCAGTGVDPCLKS